MTTIKRIIALLIAFTLVACGGGGGSAGTSPFNPEPPPTDETSQAVSIDLLASATEIGTGVADSVTITAVVKGTGNVALPSAVIRFSADTGNLRDAAATTDATGAATASLSAGANKSNRLITVQATSGQVTSAVQISVAGTELAFSGDRAIPLNATRELTVTATDSTGAPISGLQITATSSLGNTLAAGQVATGSQGAATFVYTATHSGSDRFEFSGGGFRGFATIQVSGEDFAFTTPEAGIEIPVGATQTVTVRYARDGSPRADEDVQFAATAGTVTPATVRTNSAGLATATVSSTSASPATIQARLVSVNAQATLPVTFVATTPARLVLQVSPGAIGPNPAGSTESQARLVATVYDLSGNPVPGKTVNFNRVVDPSGGNLSQASAVTNPAGQATVQYIAGPLTTASNGNGVQITATVADTAVSGSASLTVNQSALFIALGTGNVITNIDPQTYRKDWVVYVTDAQGNAVGGVSLTIRVLPVSYGKGELVYSGTTWQRTTTSSIECANEDLNFNGTRDGGEDVNGNTSLEPGNVIAVTPGNVVTDSTGRATVSLIYAESYAPWVTVRLRAQAVVSGTESSKEAMFTVTGLSSDFSSATVVPAGVISPFGVNGCADPD